MADATTNTSPLVYLHRVQALEWLPRLFGEVWTPGAVAEELKEGLQRGHDVPDPENVAWLRVVEPRSRPSEWLSSDLGAGELAALALALENPKRVLIVDDRLARRTAQAAGLDVWGTLRVALEAKNHGLIEAIAPVVDRLAGSGLWFSHDIRRRILRLAGEDY